jgi:hypothetical protein
MFYTGPRGFRCLTLGARAYWQGIYVLSAAVGLGRCGIGAFCGNGLSDLLGLNQGSRLLYLAAVGFIKNKVQWITYGGVNGRSAG